jgi:hypothetical protein
MISYAGKCRHCGRFFDLGEVLHCEDFLDFGYWDEDGQSYTEAEYKDYLREKDY